VAAQGRAGQDDLKYQPTPRRHLDHREFRRGCPRSTISDGAWEDRGSRRRPKLRSGARPRPGERLRAFTSSTRGSTLRAGRPSASRPDRTRKRSA